MVGYGIYTLSSKLKLDLRSCECFSPHSCWACLAYVNGARSKIYLEVGWRDSNNKSFSSCSL